LTEVVVAHAHPRLRFPNQETRKVVQTVLKGESGRRLAISVVFVTSRFIRSVNREFLGHDEVTDVISFPLEDGVRIEAEIYINLDRAKRQAREYKVSYREEVRRLLIHGLLHLMGYDDTSERARGRMRRREDHYLTFFTNKGNKIDA
jgi:probable rRNA maturation factor